ncbi:SDR family NAD(P)-dependent oxidoreductase [Pseudomonas qingdaonensis]|nr:SDR family NAD(P)-dependent oxidoreductase [Pseudomonas qingdaonensis]
MYGSSKAGISLFCDALRCDLLGSGVRVTEIAPGRVQTQLYRTAMGMQAAGSELYDGYASIMPRTSPSCCWRPCACPSRWTFRVWRFPRPRPWAARGWSRRSAEAGGAGAHGASARQPGRGGKAWC